MKSIPIRSRPARRLAALGALAMALGAIASPAAAAPIPAAGVAIDHASLDWTGNALMQTPMPAGPTTLHHYFSAGSSEGTEETYQGAAGNAEVLLEAAGPETVATWATHEDYGPDPGHHQVVRLLNGSGVINADGSARVAWDASFSVNFYGGLVPFTVTDPTLVVNADGSGALTATLSGCKADRANPAAGCVPFAPQPDARLATFKGIEIDPLGELTIDPDYQGVEVDTGEAAPQDRTAPGWGAWPQSFVDFQSQTGLAPHFYSSADSAQPEKVPDPIAVDFGLESVPVEGASLDWTGNELMQASLHGFKNYFSAGISNGREATYKGADGNARIYLEGAQQIATWATHESYGPQAGARQVAHLTNGSGVIDADGSARVAWDASFSVNFYGGLVPFTVTDPTLVVDEDGTGELTATLVGCEASRTEPSGCAPLTPAADVRVATFAGAEITGEELTIAPEYAGVAIVAPAGAAEQIRTGAGWGAWPQSFVDFQGGTGLSSYWYSSGDEDARKPPLPFLVDFTGHELEIASDEDGGPGGEDTHPGDDGAGPGDGGAKPSETTPPAAHQPTRHKIHRPAKLRLRKKKTLNLRRGRIVKVATIACPRGGSVCRTVVPAHVATRFGGRRYVLSVFAPRRVAAGRTAPIKVRLPKQARRALHGKQRLAVRVRVGLVANGVRTRRVVKVKVRRVVKVKRVARGHH